jgi:benzoyl-CoA reductase/2-hydroxyglutaryl-CoA dehydratase subunit BcrC/BadD/HgdB
LTGFDAFFHMAPNVSLRGTEECNRYYRMLRDELKDRVSRARRHPEETGALLWTICRLAWAAPDSTLLAENGFTSLLHLRERLGEAGR